jgi:hypothetical protein
MTIKHRNAYETLANAVGAAGLTRPLSGPQFGAVSQLAIGNRSFAPIDRSLYPKVQFWTYPAWKKHLETAKGVSGAETDEVTNGNTAHRYIEDTKGMAVDGDRMQSIRNTAHKIFFDLLGAKLAPRTWGVCGLGVAEAYNNEMAFQVPELRLCTDHWKAQKLATSLYPSWHNSHGPADEPVKVEVSDFL